MSNAMPLAQSPLRRFWLKWRFHLNILLLLIPLGFMPKYFANVALFRGDMGLGERDLGEIAVGPWSLRLAEYQDEEPELDGPSGYFKDFNAALCAGCEKEVKAVYLRVGEPRSLRTSGSIFFGSPYRMGTEMFIPTKASPDADIWITFEGWDGSLHRATIPLAEASPATAQWLKQQGTRP